MSKDHRAELRPFVEDLYASYGDPARFDAHLDPEVTIWESDSATMLVGLAALGCLRDGRARDSNAALVRPVPRNFVVDAFDGVGLVRYELGVEAADGTRLDTLFRVTDVLRRCSDEWRIVHHHAEQVVG